MRLLDGNTFRQMMAGGASGIRAHIAAINELNVFPVPDGDTGTNMSCTIESGVAKLMEQGDLPLCDAASTFAKGSLFGARGNSGVILSQFFAGMCGALANKETATAEELALAYLAGVKRSYEAVATPVEGTILTVFRESAEYAKAHIGKDSTLEDFLLLNIEEAMRSLSRTKEILPALIEADVVDSGGAGYVCIAQGMYDSLTGKETASVGFLPKEEKKEAVDYDLFSAHDTLLYGYCTECLVRLQHAKCDIATFDEKAFAKELEEVGCDSIVAIADGDILKLHAHTKTPAVILTLAQKYGEFLSVKIENMTLQHSEKVAETAPKKPRTPYGVVTVATGDGLHALFTHLGAHAIIDGGQTGNPSAEQFLEAFASLNAEEILVLPNNSNILLTARQAAELWEGGNVTVIPTKTLPQGYAVLSVFNEAITPLAQQEEDLLTALSSVTSGEVTVAIRDTVIGGISVKEGDYIGILDGELVAAEKTPLSAISAMLDKTPDLDLMELLTLFVGAGVSDEERVALTEALEEAYPDLTVETIIGGQEVYDYLIAIE